MNEHITYEGQELLPVTSDIVFKAIFSADENRELLADLLNSYLDITPVSPDEIEIVSPENHRMYAQDKLSRLDLRIRTKNNEHIDIEIQVVDHKDMVRRSLYYTALLYTQQMKKGMGYKEVGRAVSLNIVCYTINDESEYVNRYCMTNRVSKAELTDAMEMVFVELPKAAGAQDEERRALWTAFLSADSEEELMKLSQKSEMIAKAVKKLKYVSADEVLRYEYDMKRKAELDEGHRLAVARREGIEEGEADGLKKGAIEIARRLLNAGNDADMVSEMTGLSIKEVRALDP